MGGDKARVSGRGGRRRFNASGRRPTFSKRPRFARTVPKDGQSRPRCSADIEEHYAAIRPGIPAEPRQLLKRYIEQGRLGIKSGKGFYSDYEEKAPTR